MVEKLFQLAQWQNQIRRFCLEDSNHQLQREILSYRNTPTNQIGRMEAAFFEAVKSCYLAGGHTKDSPPAPHNLELPFPCEVLLILAILRDYKKLVDTEEMVKPLNYQGCISGQKQLILAPKKEVLDIAIENYFEWKKGVIPHYFRRRVELVLGLRKLAIKSGSSSCNEKPQYHIVREDVELDVEPDVEPEVIDVVASPAGGIPHTMTDQTITVLYENVSKHSLIKPMTKHAFHRAFSYGEGCIDWADTVVSLSALIVKLKRKGFLLYAGTWEKVAEIFTVKGKHKEAAHLRAAYTHSNHDTLIKQLLKNID